MDLNEFADKYLKVAVPTILLLMPILTISMILHRDFPGEFKNPLGVSVFVIWLFLAYASYWYCRYKLGWFSGSTSRVFIVAASILWGATVLFHIKNYSNKRLCESQGGEWTLKRNSQLPKDPSSN